MNQYVKHAEKEFALLGWRTDGGPEIVKVSE